MEYPAHILIKGKKYKLIPIDKKLADKKQIDGEVDFESQEILINKDIDHENILITLLHEIFHVIVYNGKLKLSLKREEKYVDLFSKELVKILQNKKNKKLNLLIRDLLWLKNFLKTSFVKYFVLSNVCVHKRKNNEIPV